MRPLSCMQDRLDRAAAAARRAILPAASRPRGPGLPRAPRGSPAAAAHSAAGCAADQEAGGGGRKRGKKRKAAAGGMRKTRGMLADRRGGPKSMAKLIEEVGARARVRRRPRACCHVSSCRPGCCSCCRSWSAAQQRGSRRQHCLGAHALRAHGRQAWHHLAPAAAAVQAALWCARPEARGALCMWPAVAPRGRPSRRGQLPDSSRGAIRHLRAAQVLLRLRLPVCVSGGRKQPTTQGWRSHHSPLAACALRGG